MGQQPLSQLLALSCDTGSSDSELEPRLPSGLVVKRREKRSGSKLLFPRQQVHLGHALFFLSSCDAKALCVHHSRARAARLAHLPAFDQELTP